MRAVGSVLLLCGLVAAGSPLTCDAGDEAIASAEYRGTWEVVKADVSPPLREIEPLPIEPGMPYGGLMIDPESDWAGPMGPQDFDFIVQPEVGPEAIPLPLISFDGPSNLAGVSPPDPVGDVGPNHYVAMSNLYFQIYDKTRASVYGPAANNTLWADFGGDCQTDNSGDPIVIHDQLSDRWILTQFTASGPTYFNCVAVSTTPDPTGSYYRYAFSTGTNFPDYPKYGVWPDALYISTREFDGTVGPFQGVGAYAINRAQLEAGHPSPVVISFLAAPGVVGAANIGDGLLPSDLDGSSLPPAGSPNYFAGSMDDGGTYGAAQDALTLWKFTADFTNPANSSFVLSDTIPITPYDTFAAFCSGRSCVPQPGTANRVDHLGYRQRPMHRLAYRNFGTHEALVTNQSVEASATVSGIRWWEIRDPNGSPYIHQEGTYAPGVTDGIHRWMGSVAMDSAGNMALGYSASASSGTYPSSRYTGRLAGDPLGLMPQGEASIHDGTGSQTGSQRWGDYTSMNIDPVDDCTFWYVNQYVPTTSSVGWRLRIGAFKFDACGTPDFYLGAQPGLQSICAGDDAAYNVNVGQISGFSNQVSLVASGQPAGANAVFVPNPVTPPGASTLTVSATGGAAAGSYPISIDGSATGSGGHSVGVDLVVYTSAPTAPVLTSPVNGAINQPLQPTFEWSGSNAETFTIEVATDPAFSNIVFTSTVSGTTVTPATALDSNTEHFWRVVADNPCASSSPSAVFSFFTEALPGDCAIGFTASSVFVDDLEGGAPGWTLGAGGTGANTWALSTARSYSGTTSYHAVDSVTTSDQRLDSPTIVLPIGADPLTLQFWNWQLMEARSGGCYDGGEVEISTDGGSTWTPLPGAAMLTDPYDGPVTGLGNLPGWCDDLGAAATSWKKAVVDVSSYAGQIVRFRFRLGTDSTVGREGWYVDDVELQACVPSEPPLFADDFEDGTTGAWSTVAP